MTVMATMRKIFWRFWWASPKVGFLNPGLYFWTGKDNVRIVPLSRWRDPMSDEQMARQRKGYDYES